MIDAREFAALWDAYRERLLAFIARKVGSREDAEDILQETFVRVHTGLCCFQEWKPMERWIYRVARNLIIDYYRGRNPTLEYKDDIESPGGGADAEDDPVAALAFSLKDMVNELPPPYREALALTEYEGLSQAEMAARLGISLAAAKARVLRAREKLRALLLECCHFELDRLGGVVSFEERCARCDLLRKAGAR
ncbi:RNA polymerase sigma factor SigZ [bacterium]|nr:RNA polymerase sigma factor SigZ [bacterium]